MHISSFELHFKFQGSVEKSFGILKENNLGTANPEDQFIFSFMSV